MYPKFTNKFPLFILINKQFITTSILSWPPVVGEHIHQNKPETKALHQEDRATAKLQPPSSGWASISTQRVFSELQQNVNMTLSFPLSPEHQG